MYNILCETVWSSKKLSQCSSFIIHCPTQGTVAFSITYRIRERTLDGQEGRWGCVLPPQCTWPLLAVWPSVLSAEDLASGTVYSPSSDLAFRSQRLEAVSRAYSCAILGACSPTVKISPVFEAYR